MLPLRVFLLSSLIISPSGWESVLTFPLNFFYRGHIEEMIQELAQQESLEVSAIGMLHEGVTIEFGEPSSPSGLSKDLPSSEPQLSKGTEMCCILSLSLSHRYH